MKNPILNLVTNGDKINNKNFNLDIYNISKKNCLTCYKADVKSIIENGAKIFCYGDKKCFSYKFIKIDNENDCTNYQSYKSLLMQSENKNFNKIYEKIFKKPNFIRDKELLKIVKPETGETIAHIQAQNGWVTNDLEILELKDNTGWTVAHEISMRGHRIIYKEILKLTDNKGTRVAEIQALNKWFNDEEDILVLPARKNTMSIAHIQAMQGWVTLNKDILNLRDNYGNTVKHIIASISLIKLISDKDEERKND